MHIKKYILFCLVILLSLITACSPKVFQPLYNPAPVVQVPPKNEIPLRDVPSPITEFLSFSLFEEREPNPSYYVNSKNVPPIYNRNSPHVVIGIPDIDLNTSIKEDQTFIEDIDPLEGNYKTSGDYNLAEAEVERALIRNDFTVIGRVKFEAVLRQLRQNFISTRRRLYELMVNVVDINNHNKMMEEVNEMLESGQITNDEWEDYKKIIDNKEVLTEQGIPENYDIPLTGSDLLLIAEKLASNYLFSINSATVEDIGKRKYPIQQIPEVVAFIQAHPGLEFGEIPSGLPAQINSDWLKVSFSAKLEDVNSGAIVWSGDYEVESINAEPLVVHFQVLTKVSNGDLINSAIASYNARLNTLYNETLKSGEDLQNVYHQASAPKEFKTEDELLMYKYNLQSRIRDLEEKHYSDRDRLNQLNSNPPAEANNSWSYSYVVTGPVMEPSLIEDANSTYEGKQNLLKHRKELIRKVTHDLISTIELER